MKLLDNLKKPFGTARMVRIKAVRYLAWEDAFDVEFEDGLSFLEPHSSVRKANRISPKAHVERVEPDEECRIGFFVHYDNGQTAEVSWSFVREFPPRERNTSRDAAKAPQVVAEAPVKYITRRKK
ncbi:MAG: hypothetical protein FJ395_21980 [Verrucomicrobia bacterium]|nr:hypothetical protein [Verrucomicrobiota bacterium]